MTRGFTFKYPVLNTVTYDFTAITEVSIISICAVWVGGNNIVAVTKLTTATCSYHVLKIAHIKNPNKVQYFKRDNLKAQMLKATHHKNIIMIKIQTLYQLHQRFLLFIRRCLTLLETFLTDNFDSACLHCFISLFLQTTNSDIVNFLHCSSG